MEKACQMTELKTAPTPKGMPLVGVTLAFSRDPLGFLTRVARECGDVAQFQFVGRTHFLIASPALIEQVLRSRRSEFIKGFDPTFFGQGLLTSEGEVWRRDRKLMAPAFQLDEIAKYGVVSTDFAAEELKAWEAGGTRDVLADITRLTMRIIGKVLFDADVTGSAAVIVHAFERVMRYLADPVNWSWVGPYLHPLSYRRHLAGVRELDQWVYATIRARRESGKDPGDLLSRLLQARDNETTTGMTDRQLRDQLVTLLQAGHETTALAITYALHLLAKHPAAQDHLAAEVDTVLGGRAPLPDDAPRLSYASAVMHETLRLLPPAWTLFREPLQDTELGGFRVPRHARILFSQWVVHHDARWFAEPEAFKPERWTDGLAQQLPHGTYFPFGDGPRVCIGNHFAQLQIVLILALVAQRYRLKLVSDRPLEFVPSIVNAPRGGLRLAVERRPGRQ